jgi:hypothetical protein
MFVYEDDLNYIWELPLLFIPDLTSPQHLQAVLGIRDILCGSGSDSFLQRMQKKFVFIFFFAVSTLSSVLKI